MNETKMYVFEPADAFITIRDHWVNWAKGIGAKKFILGISGGKDSTVVAALGCKIFGKENIIGVSLPCNGQKDMSDVDLVFDTLGIKRVTIDIGNAFKSIIKSITDNAVEVTYDTKTNLPARLRMSTIYAVGQSLGAVPLNTCNLTEDVVGYATIFGDCAGSYAPIQHLTVTEILKIGAWLGLPDQLVFKTPIDGLQPLSDEEKLGMKYADIDRLIRGFDGDIDFKVNVFKKFRANKFKTDIVRIPGPNFTYPNFVEYAYEVMGSFDLSNLPDSLKGDGIIKKCFYDIENELKVN